jgi:hypothetical protein
MVGQMMPSPMMQLQPYNWLCLDIETANGTPDNAEMWARRYWSPSATWKPETIGTRYLEAIEKKKALLSVINESPIVVISLRSESELRCLHSGYVHDPRVVHGGLVEGYADQTSLLVAFRNILDTRTSSQTTFVGHNIRSFDLPRLRWSMVRNGIRLPAALESSDQPTFDTMREFCHRFSIEKDIMIGLDDVLEQFGMESHKGIVSGADVPRLHAEGQHDLLVQYALLDVLAESELFLRMTGQWAGLK